MATLAEVARLAGVTAATVSNVLRGRGKVGQETRDRVLDAIKQSGYRPHLMARALAEGRPPTIALMVTSIANPFYPEFALAAERAARRQGQFLIICNTDEDPEIGRAYFNQIAGTLAQGMLVMNSGLDVASLRGEAHPAPVVLCMWERPDQPPALPCVAVDFFAAAVLATNHLLALGHRRISAIVGSEATGIHATRFDGFRAAMHRAGVPLSENDIRFTVDSIQGGYLAAQALLRGNPRPTAIFATNDLPALGAIAAATDMGLSVPRDMSVIGITDIQLARESRPALTSAAIPTIAAADLAVELLSELVLFGDATPNKMRIAPPPVLMPRDTTGPKLAVS
ncbi:LacI family transcriptional regulator [Robbsia andropogonis]|uniref:LacI family transcriptional regulator n=1 Tax=Robbsia andropogonis TaxID=28092 RepID=A0A0F5K0E9_9BURK|nr:LacI family DNA-binding transcriptional regulator [Robbsia andropogonis]KKB63359.1 LacI family transcriptional regulator [Robbsia andropogonis]MCP1118173.1 LacI family transcriptional regulator [Robbsia andropogonis]MCP1127546.1 LacI family transcriptional regulator [Robbsia andropogonis]